MRISFPSFRTVLKTAWHRQAPGKSSTQSEWIPSMLRKTRAFPMAGLCFTFIAVLEILYQTMEKSHGIRSDNNSLVIPIRYLPTAVAVALGITWKSIVWDIKMIMPWSILSRDGWAEPSESLFLNYIHQMEILAAFAALKKRHWAMFLGLLTGFLCGAAVAATNSLTYVELFAEVKEPAILRKTSRFDLNNGTLVYPNGTLQIPENHLGSPPYAAVAVERLPGGHSAQWSNGNYAFDSFASVAENQITANASIEAHINAFSANLECSHLRVTYKKTDGDYNKPFILEANQKDVSFAGCSLPVSWEIKSCYHLPQAWLNVTRCSSAPNDKRLLAFVAIPEAINSSNICYDIQTQSDISDSREGDISVLSTVVLLCNPKFSTQEAVVRANASTGEILYYEPTSPAKPVNVYPSIESVLLYLLNPTDAQVPSKYTRDLETLLWWIPAYVGVDPFFSALDVGKNSSVERKYINNSTLFASEVSAFASATLAQIVSVFARKNASEPTHGFITSTSPRVLIRGLSLRLSQGILFTVGVAFVLLATVLRPRTHLKTNPGQIAAVAVVLAASEMKIERAISGYCASSDEATRQALSSTEWRLLEAARTTRLDFRQEAKTGDLLADASCEKHPGWRPVVFRVLAKAGTITVFLAMLALLAVLQQYSKIYSGLCRESEISSTLFQYGTSIALLLLSYICSGIDSAVRSAITYYSLKNHPLSKRPLLFNIKDRPSFRLLWNAKSSMFVVMISSLVTLIFPFIKIAAAGLFHPDLATTNRTIEFTVDQSLMINLQNTYTTYDDSIDHHNVHGQLAFTSDTMVGRVAQYAEWSKTPGLVASQRDGILENLVFSNASVWPTALDQVSMIGDELHVNVPAVAVDARCDMLFPEDFRINLVDSSTPNCSMAEFACSTKRCNETRLFEYLGSEPRLLGFFSTRGPRCEEGSMITNYQGSTALTDHYKVLMLDWSPWSAPVFNNTPLSEEGSQILEGTFNTSLPSARAVICVSNFTLVDVDTTFTQSTRSGLNGTVIKLPWRPSRFDENSISYRGIYDSIPEWFYPPYPQTDYGDLDRPGLLYSNSLWPRLGASANIFQLLATYGEYQMHNLTKLLEPEGLREATEQMLTAYQTQMIIEMESFITNITEERNSTVTRQGVVSMSRARIRQDLRVTIILESLIAVVLCCLICIFFRFSGPALLPKEPDSIAARISLLAGSQLVQRLREQGSESTDPEKFRILSEKAELGWWRMQSGESSWWRWGIDIGNGVVRRNWDDPPAEEDDLVRPYSSENNSLLMTGGEGNASQRGEEPLLESQEDQQDHEEHHYNNQTDTVEPEANWSLSVGPSLHRSSLALSEDLTSSRLYCPPSTHQSLMDPPSADDPSHTPMQLSPLSLGTSFRSCFDDEDTGPRPVSPEELGDRSTHR